MLDDDGYLRSGSNLQNSESFYEEPVDLISRT